MGHFLFSQSQHVSLNTSCNRQNTRRFRYVYFYIDSLFFNSQNLLLLPVASYLLTTITVDDQHNNDNNNDANRWRGMWMLAVDEDDGPDSDDVIHIVFLTDIIIRFLWWRWQMTPHPPLLHMQAGGFFFVRDYTLTPPSLQTRAREANTSSANSLIPTGTPSPPSLWMRVRGVFVFVLHDCTPSLQYYHYPPFLQTQARGAIVHHQRGSPSSPSSFNSHHSRPPTLTYSAFHNGTHCILTTNNSIRSMGIGW